MSNQNQRRHLSSTSIVILSTNNVRKSSQGDFNSASPIYLTRRSQSADESSMWNKHKTSIVIHHTPQSPVFRSTVKKIILKPDIPPAPQRLNAPKAANVAVDRIQVHSFNTLKPTSPSTVGDKPHFTAYNDFHVDTFVKRPGTSCTNYDNHTLRVNAAGTGSETTTYRPRSTSEAPKLFLNSYQQNMFVSSNQKSTLKESNNFHNNFSKKDTGREMWGLSVPNRDNVVMKEIRLASPTITPRGPNNWTNSQHEETFMSTSSAAYHEKLKKAFLEQRSEIERLRQEMLRKKMDERGGAHMRH